jgi:hypothetical protein
VITALAEPDDRAGLVAACYIVGYLAFSVPALAAGVATTAFGLHSTALVYSGSLAILAAAAVGILLLRRLGRLPRFCLQLRDLLASRDDKFVIGVRVTAQPPSPGHGLGQQHPGTAGERGVTRGVRDHAGELAYHRDLLVTVERTSICRRRRLRHPQPDCT